MFNKRILKTTLSDVNIYDKVNFVIYSINTTGLYPFVNIHLCMDYNTATLTFPTYDSETMNITEQLCSQIVKKLFVDYSKYIDNIIYSGYINNDQLYVFYEIDWNTYEAEYIDKHSFLVPTLMDEIINKHCVYNININADVTSFFINNSDLVYLYNDSTTLPIEYPVVTYRLDLKQKIQFIAMFGASKTADGPFGPYYYFKSYPRAIEDYKTELSNPNNNTPKLSYGILRCCVFTENMTLDPVVFIEPDTDIDTLYYNGEYIIKHLTNHLPVTYHYLNYNINNI
jgi:hypothetical protein